MAPSHQPRSRATRWRAASLIGVHLLAAAHFLHWWLAGRTLAPVEPSEAFDTLHLGVVTVGFLFLAGAVVATALVGRFFCGWGCHVLALQDASAWLLGKLRIPTRPVRSRVLVWIPAIAALYLLAWPQLERVWRGEPSPSLHVVTDPEGWTSFTTNDLLRSFPGVTMTLVTFGVCGFLIVYVLGSRGFCAYACPYGAMFAAAERVAPLRVIAGKGECSSCGLCTAGCHSNVSVIQEVKQHGTVVNASCMRDLDCVSVCPTGALTLGVTTPPVLRGSSKASQPKKRYDFSRSEDAAMGAVVVLTLPVIRGLYDAISLLLALALAALIAYLAIIAWRLWREPSVRLADRFLKRDGRVTTAGRVVATVAAATTVLLAHSAVVQYHVYAGERAMAGVAAGPAADTARVQRAIDHFTTASQIGLTTPAELRWRLASLHLMVGSGAEARRELTALLVEAPQNAPARVRLAQAWMVEGRQAMAATQLKMALSASEETNRLSREQRRARAAAFRMLGDMAVGEGDFDRASELFESAVATDPADFESQLAYGAMHARVGEDEQASTCFKACVELRPDSPVAHNNLAATLVRLGRPREAMPHYQATAAAMPDDPMAYCNLARVLVEIDRPADAERAFERALAIDPDFATARSGIEGLRTNREEMEKIDVSPRDN